MKSKYIIITTLIITFIIFFSGCITNTEQNSNQLNTNLENVVPPISVITAPDVGFFDQEIEFSAENSYDPDGNIVSYKWMFGDDQFDQGEIITHTFKQTNDYNNLTFPIKFEVTLELIDNNELVNYSIHYIDLYPQKYQYYLNSNKLILQKPSTDFDSIKASLGISTIVPITESKYHLSESIIIYPCTWTATIYIKKPIVAFVNQIIFTIYNETEEVVIQAEEHYSLLDLWKEKAVIFSGTFSNAIEFNSISIEILGLSLRKNINIMYGGDKASNILFDFSSTN